MLCEMHGVKASPKHVHEATLYTYKLGLYWPFCPIYGSIAGSRRHSRRILCLEPMHFIFCAMTCLAPCGSTPIGQPNIHLLTSMHRPMVTKWFLIILMGFVANNHIRYLFKSVDTISWTPIFRNVLLSQRWVSAFFGERRFGSTRRFVDVRLKTERARATRCFQL